MTRQSQPIEPLLEEIAMRQRRTFTACVPEGMQPICDQCGQPIWRKHDHSWEHQADSSPRCQPGSAEAWRHIVQVLCR